MGAITKEDFELKNDLRKAGRARVGRAAYAEARKFRQAVGGAFGRQSKQFWKTASVGTAGENLKGGIGTDEDS